MDTNLAYQDPIWEEYMDGKPLALAPRPTVNHNRIAFNIARIFAQYLKGRTCEAIADGTDLYLTETDRLIPDVMVVCDPNKIRENGVYGAPDLVVEVLSPSTARADRTRKKQLYAASGVREYWLVTPSEKTVEQYFLEKGRLELHEVYVHHTPTAWVEMTEAERAACATEFSCSLFDDLRISLADVFERIP